MHVVIARRKIFSEISSDSPAVSKIDNEDEEAVTVDQSSAGQHSQCTHRKNKFDVNIFERKMQKQQNLVYQSFFFLVQQTESQVFVWSFIFYRLD